MKICYNMSSMDREKTKRTQSLKIIISEAIMVIAVIITVIVLALAVSGYWLNSDFKVERQGLLQISSIPTGAAVEIDGESPWLQRTNTSKVLSSGTHTIKLSKDGYDTWSKTIDIREGLLYRIHYPRLFLKNRETESTVSLPDATFSTVSPDRNTLLATNNTTEWSVIKLSDEKIVPKPMDISKVFSGVTMPDDGSKGTFDDKIIQADWAKDNAHILIKTQNHEWILLNVDNSKDSINLTKEFGIVFDEVEILNNSASSLLVSQGQSLRKIDVSNRQISAILAEKVISLDHYENEIVFVAEKDSDLQDDKNKYTLGIIKGDNKITELADLEESAKVVISRFYDDKYVTLLNKNQVKLYKEVELEEVKTFELPFTPQNIKVGHAGEFIIMDDGAKIATLDMEALDIIDWQAESASVQWLDDDMFYVISNGDLIVYDFDGLNRRVIANGVSSGFPATITEDKWLYYFSNGVLTREWLIAR